MKAALAKIDKITVDKLEVITVGGYNLAGDVVKKTDQAVNKYAAADFADGDLILKSKLSD